MIETSEILIRLLAGAFCGAVIGIERERKEWTAGMRTHMMVSVGSTLYMLISIYGFSDGAGNSSTAHDPSRVASQVVSGIGFIGAGTIIFLRQGVIKGLTTASGLWTVAGIGLAIGGGMYIAGVITTVIAVVILWVLEPIQAIFYNRSKLTNLSITLKKNKDSGKTMELILSNAALSFKDIQIDLGENGEAEVTISSSNKTELTKTIALLNEHLEIKSIHWHE